ncbi:FecCD family ABC transporter permease [Corynebacterium gerontici]|uniref:Putative siderophore transport system permease protein YfiZ n=1 Tax=Corynebacterium gerontici TaxID=2079234 RepID=A0A3G6IZ60_9CORY|nr:iron ABC transporter permease [Corynebacterium gerontici]AZA10793.1 putative siderophore transport system permease protein YfiZ precursor [Corynebacterium gerontici]
MTARGTSAAGTGSTTAAVKQAGQAGQAEVAGQAGQAGPAGQAQDPTPGAAAQAKTGRFTISRVAALVLVAALACVLAVASVSLGSVSVPPRQIIQALTSADANGYNHTVISDMRIPRTIIAMLVGATLGVAGAVMQAVTRNPLADPFVLGVSSGAGFGITAAVFFFGADSPEQFTLMAIAGAVLAGLLVIFIGQGTRGQSSPVRLVLAGMIGGTVMTTWTSIMVYSDDHTRETVRYIMIGGVGGRRLQDFPLAIGLAIAGMVICILMSRSIGMLALGEDIAAAAGVHTARTRLIASIVVVAMAGASVAICGPIGFVGFAVPHLVRPLVRGSVEWGIVLSAFVGASMLTAADILGRFALFPAELEASIVMGAIGAPFFILIARQSSKVAS